MKSETRMSATITDEGCVKVDIYGPGDKLLPLLEEEAYAIFNELKEKCYPQTLEVMCLFFKNVTERVFPDDL